MQFIQDMDFLVKIKHLQRNVKKMELYLLGQIMKLFLKWEIKLLQEISLNNQEFQLFLEQINRLKIQMKQLNGVNKMDYL